MTPRAAVLRAGDTLKLSLVAYRFDGTTFPSRTATFTVVDPAGGPSTAATVSSDGVVTANAGGAATVRAQLGTSVPAEVSLTILPALAGGRRVTVVDATTRRPLAGVLVAGCDGATESGCPGTVVEATTGGDGVALFPDFVGPAASYSLVSPEQRPDGAPKYDRVSVVPATSTDLLIPLSENPVEGAGGFNASLAFSEVHSQGRDWLGFAAMSFGDPSEVDPVDVLGETFFFIEPFTGARLPIPGSVVAFRQVGFSSPVPLKDRSYGVAQAGRRTAIGFAGKVDFLATGVPGSADPLAYAGALDYAVRGFTTVPHLPYVVDSQDLDNDQLCSDPDRCPGGSEELPDYFGLPGLSFTPRREQQRRTEVVFPNIPGALDTVVVAAVESGAETGVLPMGFASQTAGAPAADGTRPVPSVVLRSGSPYGGVEAGAPGIWAVAGAFEGQGFAGSGGDYTGLLSRAPALPTQVALPSFIPLATGAGYDPNSRTFAPGTAWPAIAEAAHLGKVVLRGAQSRHIVYVPISAAQSSVRVPAPPPSALGVDPASELGVSPSVIALKSAGGDDLLQFGGATLVDLATSLDAWSRYTP